MKELYDHKLTTSFLMWADDLLVRSGEAFVNTNSELYYNTDHQVYGKVAYSSPFKSWVAESSSSATIPTGFYVNDQMIARGTSGLAIDFVEGRVLLDNSLGTDLQVSGDYAFKEINTYFVNDFEESILSEGRYRINNPYNVDITGVPPYSYALPAIFFEANVGENKGFALGGLQKADVLIRGVIVSDNRFLMDGAMALFRDQKDNCFRYFDNASALYPYDELGDLKNDSYNYPQHTQTGLSRLVYIDRVVTSKISRAQENWNPNLQVGWIDFYLGDVLLPI